VQIKIQNRRHTTFFEKAYSFLPFSPKNFKKHLKETGLDNQIENKAERHFPMYFFKSHFEMLI